MKPAEQDNGSTTPSTTETEAPEQRTAQQEAEDDRDFAAGFELARASEDRPTEPVKPGTDEAPPAVKTEPTETPAKTDPPVEEDLEVPGLKMKASEVKAALARAGQIETTLRTELQTLRDTMNGTVGGLRGALDALRTAPTATPQKITVEKLKRIAQDYPEFATLLAEDLSEMALGGGQSTVDVVAMEAAITEHMKKAEAGFDVRVAKTVGMHLLASKHRDWREINASPEFAEWKGSLPPEAQEVLRTSNDGLDLAEAFDDFKAWKANGKKAPQPAADPPEPLDPEKKEKDKRLAANTQPANNGKPPGSGILTDDEAFEQGWKGARAQPS